MHMCVYGGGTDGDGKQSSSAGRLLDRLLQDPAVLCHVLSVDCVRLRWLVLSRLSCCDSLCN